MIQQILIFLIAASMAMTFFGKAIIGITLGVAVMIAMVVLARDRTMPSMRTIKMPEILAIIIMLILWCLSAWNGIKPETSMKEAAEYAGIILGGLIIFAALDKESFDYHRVFQWAVVMAAFCAAYLCLTPYIGSWAITWGSSYGSVLTIILPMCLYLMLSAGRAVNIYMLAGMIIVAGIFASGGRTAWIAFAVVMVLTLFIMPLRRIDRILFRCVMIISMIVIGGMAGLSISKDIMGQERFEHRTEAMMTMDRPASGRLEVWLNTIDHIVERPFLGYGIKSAQDLNIEKAEGYYVLHVHNAVLEMILETGILGFFAVSTVILIFIWKFFVAYRYSSDIAFKRQAMTVFICCVAYGVCSMALTSMFHAWWFLYLVVLLILLKGATLRLKQ